MLTAVSARRASTRSGLSGPDSFSFTTDVRRVSPESGTYPYDAQFLRFKTGSIDLRPVLAWRIKSNLTLLRGARGVRLAPCES